MLPKQIKNKNTINVKNPIDITNMSVARHKKPLIARLLDIKKACAAVF